MAQPVDHFFPLRPAHAALRTYSGVLAAYGHGEALGGFDVRAANGTTKHFFLGQPLRIDGSPVRCFSAPRPNDIVSPPNCRDWPADVQLGVTPVVVTYWASSFRGRAIDASDEIDVVGRAFSRSGARGHRFTSWRARSWITESEPTPEGSTL
jgi:hypothetical protein